MVLQGAVVQRDINHIATGFFHRFLDRCWNFTRFTVTKTYATDYDVSGSDGKFGVNLGAGMEFDLDKNWSLNFDIKYQLISDLDQAVFNLGVGWRKIG